MKQQKKFTSLCSENRGLWIDSNASQFYNETTKEIKINVWGWVKGGRETGREQCSRGLLNKVCTGSPAPTSNPLPLYILLSLTKKVPLFVYSLTSPYGHLYNTDTSPLTTVRLVSEMPKIMHPYLYGHLCKAGTWFCPFGVRIKEVWLYFLSTNFNPFMFLD